MLRRMGQGMLHQGESTAMLLKGVRAARLAQVKHMFQVCH